MGTQANWSKPFHGVQHLGRVSDLYWSTVEDYGSFAVLSKWFPGCAFNPMEETFDTADQARTVGETWIAANRPAASRAA